MPASTHPGVGSRQDGGLPIACGGLERFFDRQARLHGRPVADHAWRLQIRRRCVSYVDAAEASAWRPAGEAATNGRRGRGRSRGRRGQGDATGAGRDAVVVAHLCVQRWGDSLSGCCRRPELLDVGHVVVAAHPATARSRRHAAQVRQPAQRLQRSAYRPPQAAPTASPCSSTLTATPRRLSAAATDSPAEPAPRTRTATDAILAGGTRPVQAGRQVARGARSGPATPPLS
jgi:hypothetical protein